MPDTTPSPTAPTGPVGEAEADSDESGQSPDDGVVPSWLVPGLAGAGAVHGFSEAANERLTPDLPPTNFTLPPG